MLKILPNYDTDPLSSMTLDNPAVLVVDGNNNEAVVDRLYLHNDDTSKYYERISMLISNIPGGFTMKLMVKAAKPTEAEWAGISSGNTVTFENVGSANTPDVDYHSFWVYYQVPKGTPVQTQLGAHFSITYAEFIR
jgi:hypothetical protein